MANPLALKLRRYIPLSDADEIWLSGAIGPARQVAPRTDVIEEGDDPRAVNVVLDGWACRYKQLGDGRRQIVSLILPGDVCDPHVFLLDRMDHAIGALTPLTLARVPGPAIRALEQRSPALADAFRRDTLATAAIQREWTVSLGCRVGLERLAHLFCELYARLAAVGLAEDGTCPMPLTQPDLGHALGQTSVHINRTLQELRGRGLITLRGRRLTVHDRGGLTRLAHFDPTYLHFTAGTRETRPDGSAG